MRESKESNDSQSPNQNGVPDLSYDSAVQSRLAKVCAFVMNENTDDSHGNDATFSFSFHVIILPEAGPSASLTHEKVWPRHRAAFELPDLPLTPPPRS